jgi:hypothetical protein
MIEGTAASSSMAVPIVRFRAGGQSSVRKKAMPKAIGTAKTMARIALTMVPNLATSAPYSSR